MRLWAVCHPRYQGKLGPCATDLGVSQRPPWKKSLGRAARLADAKHKPRRVHSLRSGAKSKRLICRTSLHAGALYACEVDPPTRSQLHQLRAVTAQALGHSGGPGSAVAAALLGLSPLSEPRAQYLFRVLSNWRRQMLIGPGPSPAIAAYWVSMRARIGRTRGPIHQVLLLLADLGRGRCQSCTLGFAADRQR